jgi:hypothetical protein
MDAETKSIISNQTNIEDTLLIEKTFFECNSDIGATVLTLMNISYKEKKVKKPTEFDEYRKILDEKDSEYQKIMTRMKT